MWSCLCLFSFFQTPQLIRRLCQLYLQNTPQIQPLFATFLVNTRILARPNLCPLLPTCPIVSQHLFPQSSVAPHPPLRGRQRPSHGPQEGATVQPLNTWALSLTLPPSFILLQPHQPFRSHSDRHTYSCLCAFTHLFSHSAHVHPAHVSPPPCLCSHATFLERPSLTILF